nr:hypothetical protein [Patulibacter sp. SYSU D01012]
MLVPLAGATAAQAYEIENFSANIVKADGTTFESQAGGHPYQGIIDFNTKKTANGNNDAYTRRIRVDTPPGLVPNPESVPKCEQEQLEANSCPPASQIGTTVLRLSKLLAGGAAGTPANPFGLPLGTRGDLRLTVGLFNMEPREGELARFSFNPTQPGGQSTGEIVDVVGGMRPDDNGLFFTINNVPRPTTTDGGAAVLTGSTLTFWGAPGSSAHDAVRGAAALQLLSLNGADPVPGGISTALGQAGNPQPFLGRRLPTGASGITRTDAAFLNSPTSCSGPQKATLTLDSYAASESYPPYPPAGEGQTRTADYTVGADTNGLQGCDQVPFSQTTSFGESALQRDAPVPLAVQLDVPQSDSMDTLATAHVKKVAVALPAGMTISPSAANGLEACTDEQFGKGTDRAISCPAASRIGNVKITTPVLDAPLDGHVYVGQPLPGNRYRLFVNADGHGISIRLKGTVTPNENDGRVVAVFDDNPQLPFSQFRLDFDGGSKAIIASPQTCVPTVGSGELSPWSGNASAVSRASVQVTGCDGFGFAPAFNAVSTNPLSGKYAPLNVGFARPDGQQFLSRIEAKMPVGVTAKVKGVPQCSDAQITAQACPESTRIGTVAVKAGPGASPYALTGAVYFTGGYAGAPYGAVAIIHAVAGPYDLGNVVVRQALYIDPDTAQITLRSDPLPQVVGGIQLRLRELAISVDRKDFLRNPTSCGTAMIHSALGSANGAGSTPNAGLVFTGCDKLPFNPRVSVQLQNKKSLKKFDYQRVLVRVKQFESEAGIKSTSVTMPTAIALAAKNASALCTPEQARADKCPKGSIVGFAKATTTILNRQVQGPVYFVEGRRTTADGREVPTLPNLYVPLRGEVTIKLRATTDVKNKKLVTTFGAIPDAPITEFALSINGGKHGILQATRDICSAKGLKAQAKFGGYNGKAVTKSAAMKRSCGGKKKR